MDLSQLQQYLTANTQEAQEIKGDLDKAKELLQQCDVRLAKILGNQNTAHKPLRLYIKDVLSNANEPLTIREIAELVLESGYKTSSQDFPHVVHQMVVNDGSFKRKTKSKVKPARYIVEEV